jgi:hypothetical protein
MNIFFIGPYRQNNFDGIFSRNIVESIAQKHSIFARPIYYEKSDSNSEIKTSIDEYEDRDLKDYDCLIQNVRPVDCLYTNQFGKNILIPIIENNLEEELFIHQTIHKILLDNDDQSIEENKDLSKKTEFFDYDVSVQIEKNRVFDIGPLHAMKKFYFIGEYQKNYDTVLSCIRSFVYIRSKIDSDYILVIFLINVSQTDLAFINNYIQQVYKIFNSPHTINRVVICPISMSLENISAAHNTGDIFLNYNSYPKNQINLKIAQKLNKHIVDKPNGSLSLVANNNLNNSFDKTLSDKDITDSIINYLIEDKLHKYSYSANRKTKHIADIL